MTPLFPWRSLVFAPANRLELLAKFGRFRSDNYVIDLEDGTPSDEKEAAREGLASAVAAARGENGLPGRLLVRINAISTPPAAKDLEAALTCQIDGLVIPKLERASGMQSVNAALAACGRKLTVVGGIESIRGVMDATECVQSSPFLEAVYFGAEDLATELGAQRTDDGTEMLYARQRVLLAARYANLAAIDQAVTRIKDDGLFEADARIGRCFGYDGKICLNPRQCGLALQVFSHSAGEIDEARELLAAVEAQKSNGAGVINFRGQMVDEPIIRRARRVLASVAGASDA